MKGLEFENPGQEGRKLLKPEIVVKSVLSFEFLRGIAFSERSEADKALKELPDGPPFDKTIVDQTRQPPLYILMPSMIGSEDDIAKKLGKERGYNSSYVGVVLQPNPTTKNLQVDFDQTVSTLREAGVSTTVSGQMLTDHFKTIIERIIKDEPPYVLAYDDYILLSQQDKLDVYMGLDKEIKNRLFFIDKSQDLDISGTTLTLPPPPHGHPNPQTSNEIFRIEHSLILPSIDITIIPSSRGGKIDDAPPNFDLQILSAGRDLTARIVTAFEALKPKT